MPLPQLVRIRWAVRAVLVLGIVASVAANVLHARDNPISQTIAAWPPLALLLTVEIISRVPVHRRGWAAVRLSATAAIAGIAAYVSYWHMVGVAARYGETGVAPYLLPLSVDGLVVVASVSLVELAGRIRADEAPVAAEQTAEVATAESLIISTITADSPVPAEVRTDAPAVDGRGGRRPATVADALEAADGDTDVSRDELAKRLREKGLSAANGRLPELLEAVRSSGRTPAATVNGRTPQLQPA